ncbi:MAG: manganese efflux pump [Lachnospiraceae bacterium]|nr:manganese efflux pump [Lachnospiraceae bacterium]
MTILEIGTIALGLSLDVFAVTICEGAMLASIEKKKLVFVCAIFCLWQLTAVMAGNLITYIPVFARATDKLQSIWDQVSAVIFIGLGGYMLYKAWKRESIFEQRSEIGYQKICAAAFLTSVDAFFAGIGFGLLNIKMHIVETMIEIITICCVILGIYTGYRLGYEQKTKAYVIGGILLAVSGIRVWIQAI